MLVRSKWAVGPSLDAAILGFVLGTLQKAHSSVRNNLHSIFAR